MKELDLNFLIKEFFLFLEINHQALDFIYKNPEKALEMARKAHEIFIENFEIGENNRGKVFTRFDFRRIENVKTCNTTKNKLPILHTETSAVGKLVVLKPIFD